MAICIAAWENPSPPFGGSCSWHILLGVSKGITFSTMMVLPLGLFAIPLMETSLHFASMALSANPKGAMVIYRSLIGKGIDHPSAVKFITSICALVGAVIAMFQLTAGQQTVFFVSVLVFFAGLTMIPRILKAYVSENSSGARLNYGVSLSTMYP